MVLTIFREILEEVFLGAKLPYEFLCHHSALFGASEVTCDDLAHGLLLLLVHKYLEIKLSIPFI